MLSRSACGARSASIRSAIRIAILVAVQLADGVLDVGVPRQRLYSSTTYNLRAVDGRSSMILFLPSR